AGGRARELVLRELQLAAVHGLRAEMVERLRVVGAEGEDPLPEGGGGLVLSAHGQFVGLGHQAGDRIGGRLVHDGVFTTESLQVLARLPLLYGSGQAADSREGNDS